MNMKLFNPSILCAIVAALVVVGCTSIEMPSEKHSSEDRNLRVKAKSAPEESEPDLPALRDSMANTAHPEVRDFCCHDGRGIQIIQVLEEEKVDGKTIQFALARENKLGGMVIGVLSQRKYVTDEMVVKGFYMYVGTYTYQTKSGNDKTVRLFLETSEDELKEAGENSAEKK